MKKNEKRIINSIALTQEEQTFLRDLVNVMEDLCYAHPDSCESCPLFSNSIGNAYGWDCDSFVGITKELVKNGGFGNDI